MRQVRRSFAAVMIRSRTSPSTKTGTSNAERHSDQHEARRTVVVLGAQQDLEVRRVVVRQEVDRRRQHDPVAEGEPAEPEHARRRRRARPSSAGVLRERRGEEAQICQKTIGRAISSAAQRLTMIDVEKGSIEPKVIGLLQVVGQRPVQPVEDVAVEDVGDDERDADRDQQMKSRVRSSPRCSTSVASSPWRRRRGTSLIGASSSRTARDRRPADGGGSSAAVVVLAA